MKRSFPYVVCILLAMFFMTACVFSGTSAEDDIIFLQAAGPFYTSCSKPFDSGERGYLRERTKTVNEISDRSNDAFKYLKRTNDGFIKYEENLLDYLKKNEIDETLTEAADQLIAGIAANRSLLAAYEMEIEAYQEAKTSNDASKAILRHYIFESASEMSTLQVLYSDWLRNAAASVSYIVSMTSERKAGRVISSSASIYKRKIYDNLNAAASYIDSANDLYGALASVDYHSSRLYLASAQDIISSIREGNTKSTASPQDLDELERTVSDIMDSLQEPDGILPLHEDGEGRLLTSKVHAAGDGQMPGFSSLSDSLEYYREATVKTISDGDFSKEAYMTDLSVISGKITGPSDLGNVISDTGADVRPPENTSTDVRDTRRAENIGLIGTGQAIVRGMRFVSPDYAYSTAVSRIAALIADGRNISPETAENALNLVRTELNDMVGENRDEFLDVLLNQSAEEVYNTFEAWRDDIGDLSNHEFTRTDIETFLLLLGYGIEIEETDPGEESSSPDPSTSPVTTASPVPSVPEDSQEPSEDITGYDVFNIAATYDTMMNLSNSLTNENLLSIIYGWSDPVEYSGLGREDKPNGEGGIRGWKYTDEGGRALGWEVTEYGDTVEYIYHFPEDMDASMKVLRIGNLDGSIFYQVETEDMETGRKTAVRLNEEPEFSGDSIAYIIETEDNVKDGLNTTLYNGSPTFEIYVAGDVYESYTFTGGVLVREVITSYEGSSVMEHSRLYYGDGKLRQEKFEKDGEEFGLYTSYNSDGTLILSIGYKDGKYDGEYKSFFDDGKLKSLVTYKEGDREGPTEKYYGSEGHPLEYKGFYSGDESDGRWESFTADGKQKSIITYKAGVLDGEYKTFATGSTSSSSIHAFGQYSGGKKTGEWLYGYNNEGWVEKVYYENDIKVWMEKADSNVRTYYNPDGSVDRTETIP